MEGYKNIKVGKVVLDYTLYPGEDYYSDGVIEDEIFNVIKNGEADKVLHSSSNWPILYHLSDIRENVIDWCHIPADSNVLEIGSGCGAITSVLSKKAKTVTCIELSEKRSLINAERNKERDNIKILLGNFQDIEPTLGTFDVITLIGVLEYAKLYIKSDKPYKQMLSIIRNHLDENGKLIIAIENKMGLKYINGAPEDHIGQPYVGINDYIERDEVRTFSSKELEEILVVSGFNFNKFYYPVPDYKLPNTIYSSEYLPKPGNIRTYKTNYSKTRIYNFYEDIINDQLANDQKFEYMANSFIVVAGKNKESNKDGNIFFVKYNKERKIEYRIVTIIKQKNDGMVVLKKALCDDARAHIRNIKNNEERWNPSNNNIKKLKGYFSEDSYITKFISGKTLDEIMYSYRSSSTAFITKVKQYMDLYFSVNINDLIPYEKTDSFIQVFGDLLVQDTLSFKVTNVDILFSNIILDENNNAFTFDFEWIFDFPIPYKYVSWRATKEIYNKYLVYLKNKISINDYYNELGFSSEEINVFKKMEIHFNEYVCGEKRCEVYLENYAKSSIMSSTIIR